MYTLFLFCLINGATIPSSNFFRNVSPLDVLEDEKANHQQTDHRNGNHEHHPPWTRSHLQEEIIFKKLPNSHGRSMQSYRQRRWECWFDDQSTGHMSLSHCHLEKIKLIDS
jgi:hypothetical protein